MNQTKKGCLAIASCLRVLPLLLTLLGAIAYLTAFDPVANYFQRGAKLPTVCTVLAIVGVAIALLIGCLLPKGKLLTPTLANRYAPLCSMLGELSALIAFAIALPRISPITILALAALLLTVLCDGLQVFRSDRANGTGFLGYAPIVASAAMAMYYYFDMTVEMNAPFKVAIQVGLLFAMVYNTEELHVLLRRPRPRAYLTLSLCMMIVGALTAVPIPLAFLLGILRRPDYLAGALLLLGTSLRATLRTSEILKERKSLAQTEDSSTN